MTPELLALQKQVADLTRQVNQLKNNVTIPKDVSDAFKTRLGSLKDVSNKAGNSENVAIFVPPATNYSALGPPDGFFITADGKYIPFWN